MHAVAWSRFKQPFREPIFLTHEMWANKWLLFEATKIFGDLQPILSWWYMIETQATWEGFFNSREPKWGPLRLPSHQISNLSPWVYLSLPCSDSDHISELLFDSPAILTTEAINTNSVKHKINEEYWAEEEVIFTCYSPDLLFIHLSFQSNARRTKKIQIAEMCDLSSRL